MKSISKEQQKWRENEKESGRQKSQVPACVPFLRGDIHSDVGWENGDSHQAAVLALSIWVRWQADKSVTFIAFAHLQTGHLEGSRKVGSLMSEGYQMKKRVKKRVCYRLEKGICDLRK